MLHHISHYIISYNTILSYTILSYIVSYDIISYYIISYHIVLWDAILTYFIRHCTFLYYLYLKDFERDEVLYTKQNNNDVLFFEFFLIKLTNLFSPKFLEAK